MIYFKYLLLQLIFVLFAFACVQANNIEECFFKARLTNPAQFGPVYRFEKKLFWDIGVDYFDGNIAYFPVVRDSIIYFGGICPQAKFWKDKLSPLFTINDKSKEEYMEFYKFHLESDNIIPLHIEP